MFQVFYFYIRFLKRNNKYSSCLNTLKFNSIFNIWVVNLWFKITFSANFNYGFYKMNKFYRIILWKNEYHEWICMYSQYIHLHWSNKNWTAYIWTAKLKTSFPNWNIRRFLYIRSLFFVLLAEIQTTGLHSRYTVVLFIWFALSCRSQSKNEVVPKLFYRTVQTP